MILYRNTVSASCGAAACAYLAAAILAGCSSAAATGDAGSQPSSSGQTGPSGGTLLLACNNPYGASQASVTPICTDYYAQAGSEAATLQKTYQAICTGGGGTILNTPCPSAASAGGCQIGPEADDPYAEYTVEIFYAPPATEASVQANCASQSLPYVPPGGGTPIDGADAGSVAGGGVDGHAATSEGDGASGVDAHSGSPAAPATASAFCDLSAPVVNTGQSTASYPEGWCIVSTLVADCPPSGNFLAYWSSYGCYVEKELPILCSGADSVTAACAELDDAGSGCVDDVYRTAQTLADGDHDGASCVGP